MDESLKKLRKTIALMKKEGVLRLKHEGIELELAPGALFEEPPALSAPLPTDTPPERELTPEEILMWSAPGQAGFEQEPN